MQQWPEIFEDAVTTFVGSLNEQDKAFLVAKHNLVSWDVGEHINFIMRRFGLSQETNMALLRDIQLKNPGAICNELPGMDHADPLNGAMLIIHGAQERLRKS